MKYVILYKISKNIYVIAAIDSNNELLFIKEIGIRKEHKIYSIYVLLFDILSEINLVDNAEVGLIGFNKKEDDYILYALKLYRKIKYFKLSNHNISNILRRLNHYHKYIRNREVNINDLNYLYDRLTNSYKTSNWMNRELNIKIMNKSNITTHYYKCTLLSVYYMYIKRKLQNFKKENYNGK
jgi:hypothetical protein